MEHMQHIFALHKYREIGHGKAIDDFLFFIFFFCLSQSIAISRSRDEALDVHIGQGKKGWRFTESREYQRWRGDLNIGSDVGMGSEWHCYQISIILSGGHGICFFQ